MLKAVLYRPDYVKVGVLPVLSGTAVLRRNQVDDFVLEVNGNHRGWERYRNGYRVVLLDGGNQILAGTITETRKAYSAGVRTITLRGSSDLVWLSRRITYPNPLVVASAQDEGYWKMTGPAESVIWSMVRMNVGSGALAPRVESLAMETDRGRGSVVKANSRFKNVLEEAHSFGLLGNVTFNTVQDRGVTRFRFRDQRDLTRHIRLSPANGGVTSYELGETAPAATHIYVAGQGEGEARTIVLVQGNPNDWGVRAEEFRDQRQTDDNAELVQAGEERIEEGAAAATVSFTVGDTDRYRFGTNFDLGDRITVNLGGDGIIQDLVQSAEIAWDESGREVKLQVGPTLDEDDAPKWVKAFRSLRREVSGLKAV